MAAATWWSAGRKWDWTIFCLSAAVRSIMDTSMRLSLTISGRSESSSTLPVSIRWAKQGGMLATGVGNLTVYSR